MTCKSIYENCVLCGKQTNVPVGLHINSRRNYVVGAGQLCEECSEELYDPNAFDMLAPDKAVRDGAEAASSPQGQGTVWKK